MSVMPILRGKRASALGSGTMTAQAVPGILIGYSFEGLGSITGEALSDGGEIVGMIWGNGSPGKHELYVVYDPPEGSSASLSTLIIEGTPYELTFNEEDSEPEEGAFVYLFDGSTSIFADGVTYDWEVF